MTRPWPVSVALHRVFRIPDLDATACEKRPYCQLDSTVREDHDLIQCVSEGHLYDSSEIAGGFVDDCMPCGVVDVVYTDRIIVRK